MSLFSPTTVPCPLCASDVTFQLVQSVNAERRPDIRDSLLDHSFQRETCPTCEHAFRIEPRFTYIDRPRGVWIAALPARDRAGWSAHEAWARDRFEVSFGDRAPGPVREMGAELTPRLAFGWLGLREKLVAADAGIDDVALEVAKAALLTAIGTVPVGGPELRLLAVEDGVLRLAIVDAASEQTLEVLTVATDLVDEVTEDERWDDLRHEVTGSMLVDLTRLLVEPTPV